MNILVTGGAGFIGSHVVDAYIEAGHRVIVVDDLSTGNRDFVNPKATFYELGIQEPGIKKIFEKEKIGFINHHAAQSSVNLSVKEPTFDAQMNIIGSLHLLQNAVSFGVRKFLFASTGGAIYGDQEPIPASEEHPCEPVSPYGIAKLCLENYLQFYQKEYNLSALTLRYSNVYGPRQNPHGEAGVVAIFCNRLLHNQSPVIYGDGKQTRDFISIRDVVHANLIGLENFQEGIYNIGTGKETSVNSLTQRLLQVSGKIFDFKYEPPRKGEPRRSAIDSQKFQKRFGWKPSQSLEEGLLETYESFATPEK